MGPVASFPPYPGLPANGSVVQILGETPGTNARILGSVHSDLIHVQDSQGVSVLAQPIPPPSAVDTVHIVLDLGLFHECVSYNFALPGFSTRLDASVCVPKEEVCNLVDSSLSSALMQAQSDAAAVQGDIDTMCHKLSATAALAILTALLIFPLVLFFLFPVTTHLAACLASPIFHLVLSALAAVCSLCAISVLASLKTDMSSLESKLLSQLKLMQTNEFLLENLDVEMGYSMGFEIAALLVLVLCVIVVLVLRLRGVAVALRSCGGFNDPQGDVREKEKEKERKKEREREEREKRERERERESERERERKHGIFYEGTGISIPSHFFTFFPSLLNVHQG